MKQTVVSLQQQKKNKEKITMLTAYDYSTAKLMDKMGVNALLVGDSLGMVMLGHENTLSVTVDEMVHHSKAVARGAKQALVVTDMPFMSYQISVTDALYNAARLMKEGAAHAIKLEGGEAICPQIRSITQAAIPVMGHLGLTPQSVHAFGGYKLQGSNEPAAKKIIQDALAIEKAGAFALVLECIPAKLAGLITDLLTIPTIGIGAGNECDGQVLVYQDMLGLYGDIKPKFVKQFGSVSASMEQAFAAYINEVKTGLFPNDEQSYPIDPIIWDALIKQFK